MHQSMARKDQTSTRTWPGKIVHPPEHSQERSDVQRIPTNVHPSTQTNLWSIQLAWWYVRMCPWMVSDIWRCYRTICCFLMKCMGVISLCRTMLHATKQKNVMKWFTDNNIQLFKWPGNSPDLNHTKNCWNYLKNCFATCNSSCVQHLTWAIMKMWCKDIGIEYFRKFTDFQAPGNDYKG